MHSSLTKASITANTTRCSTRLSESRLPSIAVHTQISTREKKKSKGGKNKQGRDIILDGNEEVHKAPVK
jgi:hypothetical protein